MVADRVDDNRSHAKFLDALFEVHSNRFIAPLRPVRAKEDRRSRREPPKAQARPTAPAAIPVKFIWRPRAKWSDSQDIYDTEECELKRFNIDWEVACELGLANLIDRHDDGYEDLDGDGISDEVTETKAVLWDCHDLAVQVFDVYAANGPSFGTIFLNQWTEFTEDFDLEDPKSERCRKSDMDTIFVGINAKSKMRDKKKAAEAAKCTKKGKDDNSLNRAEFLVALVQIAINKWVVAGELADVSTALHRLMIDHIEPRVDKKIFSDANKFRRKAYEKPVNAVLVRWEVSLKAMFEVAAGGGAARSSVATDNLLSLYEWSTLIKALGLVGEDVSDRDAKLCFVMSRMVVIDGSTPKGAVKDRSLPFEGFLEAICRLAVLKALPTDEELLKLGCADGGEFLMKLEKNDLPDSAMSEFQTFFSDRAVPYGHPPMQPMHRCVEHVITYILRRVEEESPGEDNLKVTRKEAEMWAKHHLKLGFAG